MSEIQEARTQVERDIDHLMYVVRMDEQEHMRTKCNYDQYRTRLLHILNEKETSSFETVFHRVIELKKREALAVLREEKVKEAIIAVKEEWTDMLPSEDMNLKFKSDMQKILDMMGA